MSYSIKKIFIVPSIFGLCMRDFFKKNGSYLNYRVWKNHLKWF